MVPFVLVSALALTAAAVAVGVRVSSRRRLERVVEGMRNRLEASYPPADAPDAPVPLREPAGWVAIGDDGLCLGLGDRPDALRHVPWSALRQVVPVGGGGVSVRVARVGEVLVPGTVARRLWDHASGPRTA